MKNRFCADFIKKNQEFMSKKMGLKNDFKSTTYGIMGKKPTKYSYCE